MRSQRRCSYTVVVFLISSFDPKCFLKTIARVRSSAKAASDVAGFFKEDDNCCTDVCDGGIKDYCTEKSPCGLGDCNEDSDCLGDLVCGKNNCDGPSFGKRDDCCTNI